MIGENPVMESWIAATPELVFNTGMQLAYTNDLATAAHFGVTDENPFVVFDFPHDNKQVRGKGVQIQRTYCCKISL
jgi:hypothetical protein